MLHSCHHVTLVAVLAWQKQPEDHRRKWDRDEYEAIAARRLQEEEAKREAADQKGPPVQRELLRQREYKVDLDSRLGKSVVITKTTPAAQSGG